MQTYCRGLIDLVDSKGDALLPQMAHIALQSRRHGFSIYPFEQTVSPKPFYLSHAEYELDRFCARFGVSLRKLGISNQNICNTKLSITFDFTGVQASNTIPYHITMQLDEVTKREETSPFFTTIETAPHHASLSASIQLNLSPKEVKQAQNPIQPWYPDLPDYAVRQQAFTRLHQPKLPHPEPIVRHEPLRFACQCCGFPTMLSCDDYDYCLLCDWMDEPHLGERIPAELDIAREHFALLGSADDALEAAENLTHKRQLANAYLKLMHIANQQHPDFDKLWHGVLQCEQNIDS